MKIDHATAVELIELSFKAAAGDSWHPAHVSRDVGSSHLEWWRADRYLTVSCWEDGDVECRAYEGHPNSGRDVPITTPEQVAAAWKWLRGE